MSIQPPQIPESGPTQPDGPDEVRGLGTGHGRNPVDRRVKATNPKDLAGMAKPPMSTVSKLVLAELGVAMFEGACKYGKFNYRGAEVQASVYLDATNRHLTAWEEGQDIDPDSGLSHLTKAIASLTVLRDAQITGKMVDDRPPAMAPAGFWEGLAAKVKEIAGKYGHMKPKHYTEKNRHEN